MMVKSTPDLIDSIVHLEKLCVKHISDRYISWLNNSDVRKYTHLRFYPQQNAKSVQSFIEDHSKNINSRIWAIIDCETRDHVGNITLWIDFRTKNGTLGILIDPLNQNSKFSTSAVKLVLEYAFIGLGLNRINGGAVSENLGSVLLHKKMHFNFEGVKAECEPVSLTSNEFYDFLTYSMLKKDWLKMSYYSQFHLE
jgi:ribosomal-protein-alanine N-acetyltransferase